MSHSVLDHKVIFVSGANRGIGKAIVQALLKYRVKKIYAAARDVHQLPDCDDRRVVPVALDISRSGQIQHAAAQASDTQILINNAGVLGFASVVTGSKTILMNAIEVNYFGTLNMVQSFSPLIEKNGGGIIANISSIAGLAPMAAIGGYSAAKAALHSATQAMRIELKAKNITVHGIYPGPVDTDMSREFDIPKTSPLVVAENILAGIACGQEDIFPDPMSAQLGELWTKDPKGLEKQFAAM